ncbi:MAG TPA: ABC transporter substrate-binding protein [Planctomycetota bacterium]
MRILKLRIPILALAGLLLLPSCFTNNPYREEESGRNVYYDTFHEEPRHLDPAMAYAEDAYVFMNQIYDTTVQYHFLKRPYTLVPLAASVVPEAKLFDKDGKPLGDDAPTESVAKVVYEIHLKPGMKYANHPCFAKNADGSYRWHLPTGASFPKKIEHPDQLGESGTRTVTADDFLYQIKRMASPLLPDGCPIAPVLATYIQGFEEFQATLAKEVKRVRDERRKAGGVFYNQEADERTNPIYLDLRKFDMPGVQVIDELTYRITLTRKYPQFLYWLAMPFFVPVPWEADRFYVQSAATEQNMTLDRFPVGSGPFTLAVNQPNYKMVLRRNPNYHGDVFPSDGSPEDEQKGLLADKGKPLPFLDEAVYMLEKEEVPRWTKFMQGYYDTSGIASDMFDQAVRFNTSGAAGLTDELKAKKIRFVTAVVPNIGYYAFNMLDDVVGGYDEKHRKLRQALSIAMRTEEYIQIFGNGRGVPAQGPVPPGIFGYDEGKDGINPVVYDWDEKAGMPVRKSLDVARKLLAEAGYPNGRDEKGNALVIYYDTVGAGAGTKAYLDWLRKQFDSIGVQLQVRTTDYNRFQDKALKGSFQMLSWGWNADYPDPENFLFLLYGPNSKVKSQGENCSNYDNPKFNELFKKMENMSNGPERAKIINEMLAIVREDAPWMWGHYSVAYGLSHDWYKNSKPMSFGNNTLKYKRIDIAEREKCRNEWNAPITWPLWTVLGLLVAGSIPAMVLVYRREKGVSRR